MTPGRMAAALLVLPSMACEPPALTSDGGAEAVTVTVVEATFHRTSDPNYFVRDLAPVAGVTVAVERQGESRTAFTDARGQAVFRGFRRGSERWDVAAWAPAHPTTVVFGWPLQELILPLADDTPIAESAPTATTAGLGQISGIVEGWAPSGFGQRSEAVLSWRHAEGKTVEGLDDLQDLYARSGLDVGSGTVECMCTDPATQSCLADPDRTPGDCVCPDGAILCNDPGGFAKGVSAFSFFAPEGLIELGFVERVTDYTTGRFVEVGGAFYDPAFPVVAGVHSDRNRFSPSIPVDPSICGTSATPGAMELWLHGLGREFVMASRGGVRVELYLVSAHGLRIPVLRGETWPPDAVASVDRSTQRISVPYPFALTDALLGFSYGYRVAATSETPPETGGARYRLEVVATQPAQVPDPCHVDIPLTDATTFFSVPTTREPLRFGADNVMRWTGPSAPVRRLTLRDHSGELVIEAWIVDPTQTQIRMGSAVAAWAVPAGEYSLDYTVLHGGDEVTADILATPRIRLIEQTGSYFKQTHQIMVAQ